MFAEVLAEVPDDWLEPVPGAETRTQLRAAYVDFLTARLGTRQWLPAGGGMTRARSSPTSTSSCAACPRVDREEFVNVGVVLYCQAADFLDVAWHVDRDRLRPSTRASTSTRSARRWPSSTAVCAGDERGGAAAAEPLTQRFGFLKAPRSTVLQPGPVHGGVTADPAASSSTSSSSSSANADPSQTVAALG